jgi:hypothetical protein
MYQLGPTGHDTDVRGRHRLTAGRRLGRLRAAAWAISLAALLAVAHRWTTPAVADHLEVRAAPSLTFDFSHSETAALVEVRSILPARAMTPSGEPPVRSDYSSDSDYLHARQEFVAAHLEVEAYVRGEQPNVTGFVVMQGLWFTAESEEDGLWLQDEGGSRALVILRSHSVSSSSEPPWSFLRQEAQRLSRPGQRFRPAQIVAWYRLRGDVAERAGGGISMRLDEIPVRLREVERELARGRRRWCGRADPFAHQYNSVAELRRQCMQ